ARAPNKARAPRWLLQYARRVGQKRSALPAVRERRIGTTTWGMAEWRCCAPTSVRSTARSRRPRRLLALHLVEQHRLDSAEHGIRIRAFRPEQTIVAARCTVRGGEEAEPPVVALAHPHHRVEPVPLALPGKDQIEAGRHDRDRRKNDVLEAVEKELQLKDREVAQQDPLGRVHPYSPSGSHIGAIRNGRYPVSTPRGSGHRNTCARPCSQVCGPKLGSPNAPASIESVPSSRYSTWLLESTRRTTSARPSSSEKLSAISIGMIVSCCAVSGRPRGKLTSAARVSERKRSPARRVRFSPNV